MKIKIWTMEVALKPPNGRPDLDRNGKAMPAKRQPDDPAWAEKLRQMYDSVVAEPLPQAFDDLLKKLDQGDYD